MNSLPVVNDAADSNPAPQGKRRGPKPSSKRRLEAFRLNKSKESQARIHKEAFDDTNISLDSLLLALNDLHLGTAKQVAEVPVTTRGVGFLTNDAHERAVAQVPRAAQVCDVNTLYRVSLAQLQLQLNQSQEHHIIPDPSMLEIPHQDLSLDPSLCQEVRGMDQNFAVTADLINAAGVVEVHQQQFTPFIPALEDEEEMEVNMTPSKKRKSVQKIVVPDPYTVTFNNLRDTVTALSDAATPVDIRMYFMNNNPIPGARFNDQGLLLNPNEVMPLGYQRFHLKRDLRAAEAFFGILGSKMNTMLGKCSFSGRGTPSIMAGYYREQFQLTEGFVMSPPHARVRTARPIETSYLVRAAINLLGETPVVGLRRNPRQFAFREPVNQVEYIDIDWNGLLTRCLLKR